MGRRLLMLAAVILVAAACAGSGHTGPSANRPASATHATPTPSAVAGTGGTTAIAKGAAGAAPVPATGPSAPKPGPMQLPHPGTYSAQMTRSGSTQNVTQNVATSPASSTDTNVTTTLTIGSSQEINYEVWRPDGIYLKQTSFVNNGQRIDCPFQTPVLESPLPLRVGNHWSSSGTCSTAAPTASTTTLTLSGSIAGTAMQVIGGTAVATYVVKVQTATDTKGSYSQPINGVPQPAKPYELKNNADITDYVDPAAGLGVHTITQSTADYNGTPSSSNSDILLKSLKPS